MYLSNFRKIFHVYTYNELRLRTVINEINLLTKLWKIMGILTQNLKLFAHQMLKLNGCAFYGFIHNQI